MELHEEVVDGVQVVRITEKRLDTSVASEFKTELLRLIEKEGVVNILIDLRNVEYIDSSGLGSLLFGHRHAKTNMGRLKLVHINQKVKTLIKIANLEQILEGFDDEQQALRSFSENG